MEKSKHDPTVTAGKLLIDKRKGVGGGGISVQVDP